MAEYSDAQASCVIADITLRLESEIVVAATSTAATAKVTTCTVVEGVWRDIQVQIEQNCVDALRREQEAQHRVEEISKQLQTLTDQLNKFQPASEHAMGVIQEKLSEQVQQRLMHRVIGLTHYLKLCLRLKKQHKPTLKPYTVYWWV